MPDLIDRGLEIDQAALRERLGLPEPGKNAALLRPASGRPPETASADLALAEAAEEDPAEEDPDRIEDFAETMSAGWRPAIDPLSKAIEKAATAAAADGATDDENYQAFRHAVTKLAAEHDPATLTEPLAQSMFVSRLAGEAGVPLSDDDHG